MVSLDKIPDALGHLLLNEDGAILSSGGELENNEEVANIIYNIISLSDKIGPDEGTYKKLSVIFKETSYITCLFNKKIYILKKKFLMPTIDTNDEDYSDQPTAINT